ncbi:ubiquitin-related modifier 1 [Pleurotus eryngii]|uniref:Ubiquitin-related modifier 1 n=1 Tax=Pleurotus eryngii TaxID=5323 RepID=A0A9P6DER0_PLEER|nr:ubiquitin-related modifier 1 [Pleurotus eryngii]
MASSVSLKIEFGGGLELLFANQRSYELTLPRFVPISNSTSVSSVPSPNLNDTGTESAMSDDDAIPDGLKRVDVTYLLHHLRDHLLKERPELFMDKETVRPGILVLINDTDWELEGEGEYELKAGDELVFISTLHGG